MLVKKPLAKEALQRELGLAVNREIPVLAMITRLVEAKGLDLVMHIMDELMEEQLQLVVVGTGDEEYANALRELAWRHPGSVSVNILFNEGLARRVYAGADMFIMPSRYEACGLSQMIAMRYGTIPIVRETGGLKDSVINFDKYTTPEGNGFSFANFNAHELLFTIKRALTCYEEKPLWEKIVSNAMHSDNSWNRSAQAYADLYARIAGDTITVEPVTEEQVEKVEEEILQAVKGESAEENTVAEEVVAKTVAEESEAAEKTEETPQPVKEEVVAETVREVEKEAAEETVTEVAETKTMAEEKTGTVSVAEDAVETEQVKAPEPVEEPAVKKTVRKKTTAKKKSAEKTEEKKETVKKTPAKKTAAKKTTTKKSTAKKSAAVTEEAVAEAAPKKRGRKPGTKNKKKEDQ